MMLWMTFVALALAGGAIWLSSSSGRGGVERRRLPLIVAGVGAFLAACVVVPVIVVAANGWDMPNMWDMHGRGRDSSSSTLVQGGQIAVVRIENFTFEPGNLQVPVGASVTWTNEDSAPHDATARDGEWSTARLSRGKSDTLIFDSDGEYDYLCSIHPSMRARILVR